MLEVKNVKVYDLEGKCHRLSQCDAFGNARIYRRRSLMSR